MRRSYIPHLLAAAVFAMPTVTFQQPAIEVARPIVAVREEPDSRNKRRQDVRDRKRRKPFAGSARRAVKPSGLSRFRQFFWAKVKADRIAAGDTRHDKYLHSHARIMRRLGWATDNPGKPYPYAAAA